MLGYSIAGEESVVALPELDVCFDIGRCPAEVIPINNACISHGHMDHAAGMAYYLSQRAFVGLQVGRIIIHRRLAQAVQSLMSVWSEIEGHHTPFEIEPADSGVDIKIRRDLVVRPFDVDHGRFALGFSIVETRHKLKEEYLGLSGPELVAIKKKGGEIENRIEVPLAAYCGDTAVGDFLDLDHVRNAELLFIECTFFDRDHLGRARQGRHIHLADLRGIMERLRCPNIIFTHLTRRIDLRRAKRMMMEALVPQDRERVSLLMERPPRPPRKQRATEAVDAIDSGGTPL